jgi:hypothetical protein
VQLESVVCAESGRERNAASALRDANELQRRSGSGGPGRRKRQFRLRWGENARTLICKRTHPLDPDESGVFGVQECMGRVPAYMFDSVVGVGGEWQ